MAKYTCIAYLLWLTLGFFGAHHFYLGRDRQGFLWAATFAGLFGVGWLRDFWRIPTYVAEANEDERAIRKQSGKKPSIWQNKSRIIGQIAFGYFFRSLVYVAIPQNTNPVVFSLVVPLGTAFGTWMVSNVGCIKSTFSASLLGAYIGEIIFCNLMPEGTYPSFATGVSMLFSTAWWQLRSKRSTAGCCARLVTWTVLGTMVLSLWVSFFYFNATIVTEDGQTVKLRDALKNFINSPAWQDIKSTFWAVWMDFRSGGWKKAEETFINLADVTGEDHALQILDLGKTAAVKEIRDKYHLLAKEYHPDHSRAEDKLAAQNIMAEINSAYELLMKIRKKDEL